MAVRSKNDKGKLLHMADVMRMFNRSRTSINRWRQQGMPSHRKAFTNSVFFYENEVQEWFAKGK